ncbi:hypothetical protein BJ138DRAFT_1055601 [Hygrophoropsis aurantiaca]|uniref:Uncharacterized protein n=1 Tax=Hygrophoropsis aurantiaca TaxID=72124 RepID=A0ACB8ANU4_9AGAM|nr:hypothetical protein BJ138DRAFT_1055601 [Hygrophoropsis aurantiaca]
MTSNDTTPNYPEFLYTVLNLPSSASQDEIRERYRTLSVIFHPDKQHNEQAKDTASIKFLEIQKAYSVLSDPFLRCVAISYYSPIRPFIQVLSHSTSEVYDILGQEGLGLQWPANLRSKSPDEIRAELKHTKLILKQVELKALINPRGTFTYGVDISSLFSRNNVLDPHSVHQNNQLHSIRIVNFGVSHSVERRLNEKTVLALSGDLAKAAQTHLNRTNLTGTIRHQFSPRFGVESSLGLLYPHGLSTKGTYDDGENVFSVSTTLIPSIITKTFPPTSVSFTRRLFRDSFTQGSIVWSNTDRALGAIEIAVQSPQPFDFTASEDYVLKTGHINDNGSDGPGSLSGFGIGVHSWSYGLAIAGIQSCLNAEWGVYFVELALQLKARVEFGFAGYAYTLTAAWENKHSAIASVIGLGTQGVFMEIKLKYLHQKLVLPISLSHEQDEALALCTVILPSTVLVLGYHFILKPHRRRQRAEYFRNTQRALEEEKSELRRQIESTTILLKETAKRHMQLEESHRGLIILEASYGPTCPDEEARHLVLNVTVPVQALVHNSQVYVPGHRTKSGIQGFYDPAPTSPKSLRVRYLFRDQMHYAEIPDFIPVVLPLKEHLVV